jgi:ribosomal protein S12 methylthiotransferase accessory factor
VTGLDVDLGVPTFCAIRPTGQVLQTSNGKGLTRLSAKVSALMEAIELDHAENPDPGRLRRTSLNGLARSGLKALGLAQPGASGETFFSPDYIVDWVEGEELLSGEKVWLPASSAYFIEPAAGRTSTNGLASGNHLVEATLHALYELIERDAISSLEANK